MLQRIRQQLGNARIRQASAVWNPAATAATQGAEVSTTIPVPGASPGDPVAVSHDQLGVLAATLHGRVSAAGVVTVRLVNTTAVAVDLPSGTLNVAVISPYR